MSAQHKAEKAARLLAFATARESWARMDGTRSDLGSAIRIATLLNRNTTPTAAPLVASVEVVQ